MCGEGSRERAPLMRHTAGGILEEVCGGRGPRCYASRKGAAGGVQIDR
jgi:hypothetical protein